MLQLLAWERLLGVVAQHGDTLAGFNGTKRYRLARCKRLSVLARATMFLTSAPLSL
jgi:hypothetical protein